MVSRRNSLLLFSLLLHQNLSTSHDKRPRMFQNLILESPPDHHSLLSEGRMSILLAADHMEERPTKAAYGESNRAILEADLTMTKRQQLRTCNPLAIASASALVGSILEVSRLS